MAINYTFKIMRLEVAPLLENEVDVVTRIHYNYTGIDEDGNEGIFYGVSSAPSPTSGSFIEFNSLTEEDIISWLNTDTFTIHMQERIQEQINLKKVPMFVEKQLPWIPEISGSI